MEGLVAFHAGSEYSRVNFAIFVTVEPSCGQYSGGDGPYLTHRFPEAGCPQFFGAADQGKEHANTDSARTARIGRDRGKRPILDRTGIVGIGPDDGEDDVRYLCEKLVKLRIFDDEAGVMNRSVVDAGGDVLVVSQFTLYASTRKGNRPSYVRAAGPEAAVPLYERFVAVTGKLLGRPVQTGVFGADMQVELVNDGPVTIWIDSKRKEY